MSSSEIPTLPFPPRIDAIDAWLAALPVTNSRECCRVLYECLRALNGAVLEPQLGFQALEKFRPLVFLQTSNLVPSFLGKPFPLAERFRKLAKLSAQFHAELARGYQAVAHGDRFADDFSEEDKATIIHRALHSYQLYLLRLALTYEIPSPVIDARLNELYRLAEHNDVHQRVLGDPALAPSPGSTIEETFKRILAFRLVVPNRLAQDEIQQFYDLLQQYGRLIVLGRDSKELNGQADFSIDLRSGEAPCPRNRITGEKGDVRYLFFGNFNGKLDALAQSSVPPRDRLKESLSVYLRVCLGGAPPPPFEHKGRNAVLITGFDNLVRTLEAVRVKGEQHATWIGASKLELVPLSDHVGLNPRPDLSKSSGMFVAAASTNKSPGLHAEGEFWGRPEGECPCRVYRTEAPGYYMLDCAGVSLRPGSLVGLNTDNTLIQIGLVCRGRPESAPSSHGFELLANDVSPVRIYCDAAPKVGRNAFIAKSAFAGEDGFGVIAPPLRLRSGDGLTLESDGRRESYRVSKVLNTTVEFSQFEIVRTTIPLPAERAEE
jgi:hypothetical protein